MIRHFSFGKDSVPDHQLIYFHVSFAIMRQVIYIERWSYRFDFKIPAVVCRGVWFTITTIDEDIDITTDVCEDKWIPHMRGWLQRIVGVHIKATSDIDSKYNRAWIIINTAIHYRK